MGKAAPKITLSPSRDISFDRLFHAQSNIRRIKAGVSVDALANDIARRTLLQSLNVRPERDSSGQETGRYEVPAGGRRYRVPELLVNRGRLAKDAPIPCVVRAADNDILAEDDSYAENAMREQTRATMSRRSPRIIARLPQSCASGGSSPRFRPSSTTSMPRTAWRSNSSWPSPCTDGANLSASNGSLNSPHRVSHTPCGTKHSLPLRQGASDGRLVQIESCCRLLGALAVSSPAALWGSEAQLSLENAASLAE